MVSATSRTLISPGEGGCPRKSEGEKRNRRLHLPCPEVMGTGPSVLPSPPRPLFSSSPEQCSVNLERPSHLQHTGRQISINPRLSARATPDRGFAIREPGSNKLKSPDNRYAARPGHHQRPIPVLVEPPRPTVPRSFFSARPVREWLDQKSNVLLLNAAPQNTPRSWHGFSLIPAAIPVGPAAIGCPGPSRTIHGAGRRAWSRNFGDARTISSLASIARPCAKGAGKTQSIVVPIRRQLRGSATPNVGKLCTASASKHGRFRVSGVKDKNASAFFFNPISPNAHRTKKLLRRRRSVLVCDRGALSCSSP